MKRRLKRLIQQPLIIQPGDKLIIRVGRDITHAQAAKVTKALLERIPGVDVVVIGCDELAVYRP